MRIVTEDEFVETMVAVNRKSLNKSGRKLTKGEAYFMRQWLRQDYQCFKEQGIKLMWNKPKKREKRTT